MNHDKYIILNLDDLHGPALWDGFCSMDLKITNSLIALGQ